MAQATYLEYTCIPSPLTLGQTQDIIVIGTLKTADQLGIALTSATLSNLVLDFGTVGAGPTNLTDTAFNTSNIEAPPNWTVAVSGATCTLTPPSGSGLVTTNAVVVMIKNVEVNATVGNVTLTVSEAATPAPQTGGEPPTTSPADPGIESIVLPKTAAGETQVTLTADPENIAAGQSTTVNWSSGSASDTFNLLYISQGNLVTITSHANGTSLGPDDVYPDQSLTPPDPLLVLNSDTVFVLQIQASGGEASYVTTPVIVAQPNLFAQTMRITGPASGSSYALSLGGHGNFNIDAPGTVGGRFVVQDNGNVGINTPNPSTSLEVTGNASISGSISANSISTNGATINGNLTAGSLNASQGAAINGTVSLCNAPDGTQGLVIIGGTAYSNVMLTVTNNQSGYNGIVINSPASQETNWALMVSGQCINSNGSWSQPSDIQLKEQVQPFKDGLAHVLRINPIRYNFKEETGLGSKTTHVGVSAQELQEVAPYMIGRTKLRPDEDEEYLSMNSGPMTYMLINTVKELHAEMEVMKMEMEAMREELKSLK